MRELNSEGVLQNIISLLDMFGLFHLFIYMKVIATRHLPWLKLHNERVGIFSIAKVLSYGSRYSNA